MGDNAQVAQQQVKAKRQRAVWSIGVYAGETLFSLEPVKEIKNPVLCARDVVDIRAEFVADPFMIQAQGNWYMFFEVMNAETQKGEIGLAISSDGFDWSYQQIVLNEAFHLSYPYVFYVDGEYYLIPESYEANSLRLYRADPFPHKWRWVETIMQGPWVDPSLFFLNGLWWMFTSPVSPENETLNLFYADSIRGVWHEHPMSPIVQGNNRMARPGGRVVVIKDKAIRFTQDCYPRYGTQVRAFEVTELTTTTYKEREVAESPILYPGESGWRQTGMHHIDPHFVDGKWIACVDGWRFEPPNPQTGEIYHAEESG
jgi:hypothetical protein